MDLGRALVTSVVLGAVAYVLPRLAYLALEREKVVANQAALETVFKPETTVRSSGTVSNIVDPEVSKVRPPGMYM